MGSFFALGIAWLALMAVSVVAKIGPLKVVMTALARCGTSAGVGLRLDNDRLLFDHTAGLTIAVKP